ncbi:MAG TPA: FAD-binding oxidoreductase [Nocardioidaceae bacterium]|jgi:FAD/FMN-containing dehydrogenase|nr:FAD-binding oxidoreductase [Nocardioidaceae bacterium]
MTSDISSSAPVEPAAALHGLCSGAVHLPGDAGYDTARSAWNLVVDQRPAAVCLPANPDEVADVVRAAAAAGLRVAGQTTGHNAGPLGDLSDTVIVRTSAMVGVQLDVENRVMRAEGGTVWLDAVEEAGRRGLATLHGSSPDVGIAGYSLGGGLGWYARKLGLACNSVTAVELVTADGSKVRVDADHEPELFWALRGGGGSFGVVTAVEFAAYPIESSYAGMLVWDQTRAEAVLPRWLEWCQDAPETVTTSFRLMNLPPIPDIPEPFRGRSLTVIDGAVLEDDERAEALLRGLRELGPELDTFVRTPSPALAHLHMDPEHPVPAVADTTTLSDLPAAGVDTLLATAGPGSGSILLAAELRQLGGALARPAQDGGARSTFDGAYMFFAVAIAPTPEIAELGRTQAERVVEALTPYSLVGPYLNFAERSVDVSTCFDPETWARLCGVKAAVDPADLFRANHPVPASAAPGEKTPVTT